MTAELFHAGFVTQNAAAGDAAAGIDSQDGYLASLLQKQRAKAFYKGALPRSRNACDADPDRVSGARQDSADELLPRFEMSAGIAFYQRDGL